MTMPQELMQTGIAAEIKSSSGLAERGHFILLDIMRTVAALAVVCYHWRMFHPDSLVFADKLPFYGVLAPVYEGGWMAVDFFFMLSGFVMSWTYRDKIKNGAVGTARFFILRFSRLYPLHLLTLLLVTILQLIYVRAHGHTFMDRIDDSYHFVLHLFLASQWGLQAGPSFNDPIWSVSIEVLLYCVFFLFSRYAKVSIALHVLLLTIGFILFAGNLANGLGRGLFCFFIGGLIAEAWRTTIRSDRRVTIELMTMIGFVVAFITVVFFYQLHGAAHFSRSLTRFATDELPRLLPLTDKIEERLSRVFDYSALVVLLYPIFMFSLLVLERRIHKMVRPFASIGNVSYSSYLLHFSLQVIFVLLLPSTYLQSADLSGQMTLLGFLVILLGLSASSFVFIERPLQNLLRRMMLRGTTPLSHEVKSVYSHDLERSRT